MKKILTILTIITLVISSLTGCGKMSLYADPDSTYKVITDVPGISFAIPASVSQATAINRISSDMEFDSSITYSYKDGTSTFLTFNMENIVILVEKGTDFGFDLIPTGEDKSAGLNNSPVINTWMTQLGKNFSYEEVLSDGVYKMIADVSAEVSITTRVFGDFTGQLAVVTDGTTEYALFIGAPEALYDQISGEANNVIGTVVKSLKMTYVQEREENAESGTEVAEEAVSATEVSAESTSEASIINENSSALESIVPSTASSEEDITIAVEEPETETESESSTEVASVETTEEIVEGSMNLNNQKNMAIESEGSFYSNVYSALKIGEAGRYIAINGSGTSQQAIITITNHYGQGEADNLIKRYCASSDAKYEYMDAPEGTHWEAVEYDIDKSTVEGEIYTNIKFTGLDGEKLYFKGIGYTTRTYDIANKVKTTGTTESGYISYYAVPNGCTEYMLVVGDGTDDNGVSVYNAYYTIENN